MNIRGITFLAVFLALFARAAIAQDFVTPKVNVDTPIPDFDKLIRKGPNWILLRKKKPSGFI